MDSTPIKAPETMAIAELLGELEAFAQARGDDRAVRIARSLRDKVALLAPTPETIPLGWAPYGQGARGLDAVKE